MSLRCPHCNNERIWKDGMRYVTGGQVQRYFCRSCGHRFSDGKVKVDVVKQRLVFSDSVHNFRNLDAVDGAAGDVSLHDSAFALREDIGSHDFSIVGKTIKEFLSNSGERRVCARDGRVKNLVEVESRTENQAAGATEKSTQAGVKEKLVNFAWWMKKQGYADTTIRLNVSCLRTLCNRGAELSDPESVKGAIARQTWSDNRTRNVINAYTLFLKTCAMQWEKPKCKVVRKIPFIPTEQELDALIAGCGRKTATFLQLLKETAMRSGEAKRLEWTDIDFEKNLVTLNLPEKRSNARIWKVSSKLINMLNCLPRSEQRIFGDGPITSLKTTFYRARKRLAAKLQNPRLQKTSFHTFRHWKATMLYHKTKDPYYVKNFLGHKSLKSTEIYITIEQTVFEPNSDEFTVKVVNNPEEIKELLEVGFEYVCEKNGSIFLRKRK